jgi:hypothetical protein
MRPVSLLAWRISPSRVVELLFGALAHAARVDDDDVRVARLAVAS